MSRDIEGCEINVIVEAEGADIILVCRDVAEVEGGVIEGVGAEEVHCSCLWSLLLPKGVYARRCRRIGRRIGRKYVSVSMSVRARECLSRAFEGGLD